MKLVDRLAHCIKSGLSLIVINTIEVTRAIGSIKEALAVFNKDILPKTNAPTELKEAGFKISEWDAVHGWKNSKGKQPGHPLGYIARDESEYGVYVLTNHHLTWVPQSAQLAQTIAYCYDIANGKYPYRYVIFVGAIGRLPIEISDLFVWMDLELPTRDELSAIPEKFKGALNITSDLVNQIADASAGMTQREAENAFRLSLVKNNGKKVDVSDIFDLKAESVKRTGFLEYWKTEETAETVGGLYNIKKEVEKIAKVYHNREAAEKYGVPVPSGMLICGITGTGKTLISQALANLLGVPFFRCDIGKLMNSFVGETEKNTRELWKLTRAVSPALIQFDEVEKLLGGWQGDNTGVMQRVLQSFLVNIQDKNDYSFYVATANDISTLPPELLSRFDLWFVDLPDVEERSEIAAIHIKKVKRDPKKFNLKKIARATDGYVGREIQAIIKQAMYDAFFSDREVITEDILRVVERSPKIAETKAEEISALRKWARGRAKLANVRNNENPAWYVMTEEEAK